MSDETTEPDKTAEFKVKDGEWSMPEPIFQSSEGHTPKKADDVFEGDEHETEIANIEQVDPFAITPVNTPHDEVEDVTVESIKIDDLPQESDPADDTEPETGEASAADPEPAENKIRALPPPKKKGGCAKSAVLMFGIIGFILIAVTGILIYFYRPDLFPDRTF